MLNSRMTSIRKLEPPLSLNKSGRPRSMVPFAANATRVRAAPRCPQQIKPAVQREGGRFKDAGDGGRQSVVGVGNR